MIAGHRAQRNLTQLAVPSTIGVVVTGNISWALRSISPRKFLVLTTAESGKHLWDGVECQAADFMEG